LYSYYGGPIIEAGSGNFDTTSGSSGFVDTVFGSAVGSSAAGGAGSQIGSAALYAVVAGAKFDGTTTSTGAGAFGAGFSPFGPTGGFGAGSGGLDIASTTEGINDNYGFNRGYGPNVEASSVGAAANFGGGMGTATNVFGTAGGLGSGASSGAATGLGDLKYSGNVYDQYFDGAGNANVNFNNVGQALPLAAAIVSPIP
jgi:hypothetical protein